MIASGGAPGMPSVTSGIIPPPTTALFAVSVATTPSTIPVPYFSGCFDVLRASL